jgi:hypothetical protein
MQSRVGSWCPWLVDMASSNQGLAAIPVLLTFVSGPPDAMSGHYTRLSVLRII